VNLPGSQGDYNNFAGSAPLVSATVKNYTARQLANLRSTPMLGLGTNELLIVLVIVLILFGGAKLPQMMKGLGEGMKEFRKATRDEDDDVKSSDKKTLVS
jgi:sec-independent protein translocase protein TatA